LPHIRTTFPIRTAPDNRARIEVIHPATANAESRPIPAIAHDFLARVKKLSAIQKTQTKEAREDSA
jgi:hypothetical protein